MSPNWTAATCWLPAQHSFVHGTPAAVHTFRSTGRSTMLGRRLDWRRLCLFDRRSMVRRRETCYYLHRHRPDILLTRVHASLHVDRRIRRFSPSRKHEMNKAQGRRLRGDSRGRTVTDPKNLRWGTTLAYVHPIFQTTTIFLTTGLGNSFQRDDLTKNVIRNFGWRKENWNFGQKKVIHSKIWLDKFLSPKSRAKSPLMIRHRRQKRKILGSLSFAKRLWNIPSQFISFCLAWDQRLKLSDAMESMESTYYMYFSHSFF